MVFCRSVLRAENGDDEKGITQDNYLDMPLASLYSPVVGDDMFLRNSVRAVGNYQEIWDKTNTMERDVKERTTEKGFTFAFNTMIHDSVRFVGSEE